MQVLSNSLSIKQTLRYHANFKFVRSGILSQLLAATSFSDWAQVSKAWIAFLVLGSTKGAAVYTQPQQVKQHALHLYALLLSYG